MLLVGSLEIWLIMIGLIVLLCVYWAIKWVVSLWTGS